MKTFIQRFFQSRCRQRGAGKVEYILLVAIVGIGAIGALKWFNHDFRKMACEKVFVDTTGNGNALMAVADPLFQDGWWDERGRDEAGCYMHWEDPFDPFGLGRYGHFF